MRICLVTASVRTPQARRFRYFIGLGAAAADAMRSAIVSKNIARRVRGMLRFLLRLRQAPPPKKRQNAKYTGRQHLSDCFLPVAGHAGKFGSQVRPAGGRCHCADRGDTVRYTAAQGRPAEDNGVWKLAGAGVGKVSIRVHSCRPTLHWMRCFPFCKPIHIVVNSGCMVTTYLEFLETSGNWKLGQGNGVKSRRSQCKCSGEYPVIEFGIQQLIHSILESTRNSSWSSLNLTGSVRQNTDVCLWYVLQKDCTKLFTRTTPC